MLTRLFSKLRCSFNVNQSIRSFYDSRTQYDTIFAPLTTIQSVKGSPLGVIRLSGRKTEHVVEQLTRRQLLRHETSVAKQRVEDIIKPRCASLSKILDPTTSELIDVGLVLWFPNPNSYTGEDVCELHLHGSQAIISNILNILGNIEGLRPAEPGEFTRRSLLNGKTSLIQAESLPDLIASQTDNQRRLALKGYDGSTRDKYEEWIRDLVSILAHLEASIDFGEDELIGEVKVVHECIQKITQLTNEISLFIEASSRCRDIIQDGVRVTILGKPNAGKSTIMNLLCRRNKSIVSDLSGTTRDVVEHSFELGGHRLTISDTAGLTDLDTLSDKNPGSNVLLKQHARIEREGIRKALETAKEADVILYVIDGGVLLDKCHTTAINNEVDELLGLLDQEFKPKLLHIVINKIDLSENLRSVDVMIEELVASKMSKTKLYTISTSRVSCETKENFNSFLDQLKGTLNVLTNPQGQREDVCSSVGDKLIPLNLHYVNERHLSLLKSSQRHLSQASLLTLETIDEMAQHVRESVDYLSRIVGSVTNDQVIDVIFRDFCIGK